MTKKEKEILRKELNSKDEVIFNSLKNKNRGINVKDFLKILEKIDKKKNQ